LQHGAQDDCLFAVVKQCTDLASEAEDKTGFIMVVDASIALLIAVLLMSAVPM
jgi:hypothetical protein